MKKNILKYFKSLIFNLVPNFHFKMYYIEQQSV